MVSVRPLLSSERFRDMIAQLAVVPGLREELVDGALINRIGDRLQFGIPREYDAHGFRVNVLRPAEEFHAGHGRHALIGNNDVNIVSREELETLLSAPGGEYLVAVTAK